MGNLLDDKREIAFVSCPNSAYGAGHYRVGENGIVSIKVVGVNGQGALVPCVDCVEYAPDAAK